MSLTAVDIRSGLAAAWAAHFAMHPYRSIERFVDGVSGTIR